METWIKISLILSFIIVLICVTFGLIKIRDIIAEEENANKARYCHYCHYAYIHRTHEDYIYCPQCGNRLRTIDDDPFKKARNKVLSDEDNIEIKKNRHKDDKNN